jgi:bacterioferritin-associated ferredoxin
MYVCLCKAVTDGQIRRAVAAGTSSLQELRECLGVATDCRLCTRSAVQAFEQARALLGPVGDAARPVSLCSPVAGRPGCASRSG